MSEDIFNTIIQLNCWGPLLHPCSLTEITCKYPERVIPFIKWIICATVQFLFDVPVLVVPVRKHLIYVPGTSHLTKQTYDPPEKPLSCCGFCGVSCDSAKHTSTRLGPLLEIPTVPAGETVYMKPTWWTHSFMTVHGACLFYWSCTWITFSLLTLCRDPVCFSEKSGG